VETNSPLKMINSNAHLVDSLESALADHGIISSYLGSTRRIAAAKSSKAAAKEIGKIRALTRKLAAHFTLEEKRIFPTLQTASQGEPTSRYISRLCADHRRLLREAKVLDEVLQHHAPGKKLSDDLFRAMVDFLGKLQKHAASEDELLIPLLREMQ
jgi:hemerythrin-like domain-containing protein